MDHPLHLNCLFVISFLRLNRFFFGALKILASNYIVNLCFKIYICQVCWPWIIYKWLWQATQKFLDKHFDHCPIFYNLARDQ
jgi:hypothetical protein